MSGPVFIKTRVAGAPISSVTSVPSSNTLIPQSYPSFRELKGINGISITSDSSYIYVSNNYRSFNITAGPGLLGGVITTSGQVSLPVLLEGGTYTNPLITVDKFGRITSILSTDATVGTVTGITAGPGLTGGTINDSGIIGLAPVGTPGTYTRLTVDQYGRVTAGGALTSSDITAALGFTPASSSAANITNGSINGTTIGNITPASGNFAVLTIAGNPVATSDYVQQAIAQQAQRFAPLSITLNWAGGVDMTDGTYLFTGSAPYRFSITSLTASVGYAMFTVTVRNRGSAINSLTGLVVDSSTKMNFQASGNDLVVNIGDIVDAVVTVTGSPTDAFLTLNANKI
jgi:hypothetical protein